MRLACGVLIVTLTSWSVGVSAADSALTSVIAAMCTGTLNADLTAKCEAAKLSALEQAIQADAAGPSATDLSKAKTDALQKQVDLIKSTLAIDAATLTAIKPGAATLPDMTAVVAAALQQGFQDSARSAAAAVSKQLEAATARNGVCTANGTRELALVFFNQDLGELRKGYFQALDSTAGFRDHIRNAATLLGNFRSPAAAYPPAPPIAGKVVAPAPGAPEGPGHTSFTAAVAGAGLLLDLVGKGAALAASFRPVYTAGSSQVSGDVQAVAQAALIGELANLGNRFIYTDAIVAHAPATGPGSIRAELLRLRAETFALRRQAISLSVYDYVAAANAARVDVPTVGSDGKPLSKTDQATQEQVLRARLVAEAAITQALLTKVLTEIATLTQAAEDLNTRVFSGYPAKDQIPAAPPLITAYDKWEGAKLTGRCVVTLHLKPGSANVDRLAVQSAFGSPKYHFKVSGTQPWMLAGEQGEVLAAGTMTTSANWERFGPSKD